MRIRTLALGLALAVSASVTQAATLFSLDGPDFGSTAIGAGQTNDAVAQRFEVTEKLENVDFTFDGFCLGCAGEVQLITGLMGPTASVTQRFIETTYAGIAGLNAALSGITLETGIYTMIISMTQGDGVVRATNAPVFTGSGVSVTADYLRVPTINPNALFLSENTPVTGSQLQFTISGDLPSAPPVTPVPLPASALLLIGGVAGLGLVRNRRRQAA